MSLSSNSLSGAMADGAVAKSPNLAAEAIQRHASPRRAAAGGRAGRQGRGRGRAMADARTSQAYGHERAMAGARLDRVPEQGRAMAGARSRPNAGGRGPNGEVF